MERAVDTARVFAQVDVIHLLAQRQRDAGTSIAGRGGSAQFPGLVLEHLSKHRSVAQTWAADLGQALDNLAATLHACTLSVEAADHISGGG